MEEWKSGIMDENILITQHYSNIPEFQAPKKVDF